MFLKWCSFCPIKACLNPYPFHLVPFQAATTFTPYILLHNWLASLCVEWGWLWSLLSSSASYIIWCQRQWEYNIDGPMVWSNMANPIFLFGYKWITSYSPAHFQQNDEREKKKKQMEFPDHCIPLYFSVLTL